MIRKPDTVTLKCGKPQRRAWERAAKKMKLNLSEYIRFAADEKAKENNF